MITRLYSIKLIVTKQLRNLAHLGCPDRELFKLVSTSNFQSHLLSLGYWLDLESLLFSNTLLSVCFQMLSHLVWSFLLSHLPLQLSCDCFLLIGPSTT